MIAKGNAGIIDAAMDQGQPFLKSVAVEVGLEHVT